MKLAYQSPGLFIRGDCLDLAEGIRELPAPNYVFLDPLYERLDMANLFLKKAGLSGAEGVAITCFMYPISVGDEDWFFNQVAHWIKPISTKNTILSYSNFVEAICVRHGDFFNKNLHWSTRTGVFTDTLIEKQIHPHQKPFSLVEKLVLLHTPPGGTVLDPFCGSQVVRQVCDKHGFRSLSIDLKDWLDNHGKGE